MTRKEIKEQLEQNPLEWELCAGYSEEDNFKVWEEVSRKNLDFDEPNLIIEYDGGNTNNYYLFLSTDPEEEHRHLDTYITGTSSFERINKAAVDYLVDDICRKLKIID